MAVKVEPPHEEWLAGVAVCGRRSWEIRTLLTAPRWSSPCRLLDSKISPRPDDRPICSNVFPCLRFDVVLCQVCLQLKRRFGPLRSILRLTKTIAFRAMVLSNLLYAYETLTLYRRDIKSLEWFQQTKLRRILHISWVHCITNNYVHSRTSFPNIKASILQHHLRWAAHASRTPTISFYATL